MKRQRVTINQNELWHLMTFSNVSQNSLASELDISSGYLSQLMNGRKSPSPELRNRLLRRFPGSTFNDIFIIRLDKL